ncbi:sulfide:quinone oxidoreductase [Holotrichia oblita]|uniref:Sulfide:quinone oxidoreductase n=1 Tax=Holotrichia oblita TaxID=644536 RepID=A0ACB9TKC3_HOLOL|nr:sulfide:quinone oxidoreductase [Holotrichia oblita]
MQKHMTSLVSKIRFYSSKNLPMVSKLSHTEHCCKILVVGGGCGGCSVAARLAKVLYKHDIIIVEPRDVHVFKPAFTLIGAGISQLRDVTRPMLQVLPDNAIWVKDSVEHFCPADNMVILESGATVEYEFMVISVGLEPNFNGRKQLNDVTIVYANANDSLFPVDLYEDAVHRIAEKLNVCVQFGVNLVKIIPENNKAIFACTSAPENTTCLKYSFLHVSTPMKPPKALKKSKDILDNRKFVDVDERTLQHRKFMNVFALGDCASLPTSKTASAISVQSYVVFKNIMNAMEGNDIEPIYDGYTASPIFTGYDSLMLAEFDYSKEPKPTFPFNIDKDKAWLFHLQCKVMPHIYWNHMLKGTWDGPEKFRKIFRLEFLKRRKEDAYLGCK